MATNESTVNVSINEISVKRNSIIKNNNVKFLNLAFENGAITSKAITAGLSCKLGTVPSEYCPIYNYSKEISVKDGLIRAFLSINSSGDIMLTFREASDWKYMSIQIAESFI